MYPWIFALGLLSPKIPLQIRNPYPEGERKLKTKNKKILKRIAAVPLAALTCASALSLSSCRLWDWLWTREYGDPLESGDLVVGSVAPDEETDSPFGDGVPYLGPGSAHDGTDIYYHGADDSPNEHRIIVIDAGHQTEGSAELEPNGPGAESMKAEVTWGTVGVATGQTEYELNLRVALLLRDELIRRGYSVVMIRETNDVSISNMERAQIANKYEAAAYVRIHANGWEDESLYGAMALCQSSRNPYPECVARYEESALLSRCVLTNFCDKTDRKNLGVREDDSMTGTNWSRVPTTIVEMGFLTNPAEDRAMQLDFFRQAAAIGIADGLDAYFKLTAPAETDPETEGKPGVSLLPAA
jgi:N-acetylmuramoyl-L-alanine amidase